MDSQFSEGISEVDFKALLKVVSDWYDQRRYINMLKVLYRDHVKNISHLYSASKTMDLLNWLIVSGHLYGSSDLSILYDTIKITKQFGLEREIKAIIPSCPTIRGVIITKFTKRRQRITRLGMILTNEAIEMIGNLYRLNNRYVDSWSLIFELEQRMIISEENMEKFIEDLKELNLPLAVKVLTEDLEVKIPVEILARGPEALKAFNEALSDGETEVNQGTTIFLGLERVGKTSTIKSFLNYPFDLKEDITDAIANTQTVCTQDSNNELNWKETTHDHSGVTSIYEEKLADVIVKELSQIEKEEKVGVTAEPLLPDMGVTAKTSTGDIQGQSSPGPSRSADREPESKNTQQINEVPENITSIVVEKMKFTEEATTEWRKSSKEFIMKILDFGGQPIYHVIQRIFLVSFAVVCVVFNLKDDLDSPAEVRDPTTGEKYKHRMTNLEFILYWIRSVYTNSRDSELEVGQLSPPVLVIGTHLGSIGGNEEEQKNKAEKIFSKIRQAIAGKPYEAMVSTFFAIENSLPFPESKASSIMKQIYKFAKKMVRTLPLKWLRVQQEIQKKKKKYIYLPTNKVISLVEHCGIRQDTHKVLLEYLHDIGEILYFPEDEALKDIIVLDLMRIVDMFKTIITVKDPNLQKYALRDAWRRLNSGVLEEHLLRHLCKQFNFSSKTFDFFIYLMQKFGLVCEKKSKMGDERVFYVLSRLKPERVLSPPPTENRNCAVSIFHDFSGYLPDDLFQRGVTKFIEKFQVEDNEPTLSYEHVELYIGELHHVVLNVATIKNRRMFQTTIIRLNISNADQLSREDEPSPTVCKKVLDFLKTGLKNFSQTGARGVELTMYIPCVCCPNGDAHMHIVRTFDKNVLPCGSSGMEMTRYNRLFGDSMPMQAVPPSHVTVNKPEAPEDYVDDVTIETVSEKIGLRRKKFGVRLGLSWSEVNKFNTQKGEEAVKNMMWYWRSKMQSRMQHQLKLLCVALRHYGFKTFADSLFKGDTESIVIEEQAEQDCFSDQDLLFICDNLPVGWRKLARQLGFEQAVIDDITTYNHQWESDSNMHMLAIWKMGHSEKQMPIMIKALKKTGFDQVAERVCERHDYNDKAVYQNRCRPKGNWWYWPTWAVLLLGCILFVVFLTLAHTQDKMQNTLYTAVYVVGGIMSSISFFLLLSDKLKKYRKRRKSKEANRRYTRVLQKDI